MVQLASMGIGHWVKLIVIYCLGLPLAIFGHRLFLAIGCFWLSATAQDSSMTNVNLPIALADALIADARVPIKSASVLCAIGNRIPQP
jgi:hypothetical protein